RFDWRLTSRFVRPYRALVYPRFDHFDLVRRQRAGRRHLPAVQVPNQPLIQAAAVAVAGTDVGDRAAAHRVAAAIEPESVHLLGGTVAAVALLSKDRLDVASEIHARRRLRGTRARPHRGRRNG